MYEHILINLLEILLTILKPHKPPYKRHYSSKLCRSVAVPMSHSLSAGIQN